MGRTKRAAAATDDTEDSPKELDAKSKAIEKAKARISREKAQKSYREPSDSETSDQEFADLKNADKDFSGDEDPSEEDSGSEWDGQSSGSEYGKKKKKVVSKGGAKGGRGRGRGGAAAGRKKSTSASPKKGAGRGRGRPSAGAAKNGKKAPAKRARDASDESESEAESSGSEFGKKKASPAKKATPARGRPAAKAKKASPAPAADNSRARRGRPAKTKSYKELSEDEDLEVSEEEKKPVSKRAKLDVDEKETKTKVTTPQKKEEKKDLKDKNDEDSEEDDVDEEMKSDEEEEKKPVKKANGSAPPKEKADKEDKKEEPESKKEVKETKKTDDDEEEDDEKDQEDDKADKDTKDRKIKEKSPAASESGESLGSKSDDAGGLKNKTDTDYSKIDFSCDKKTPKGEEWNFKISTWNVSGIRSWLKKNGMEYLKKENPDVMCLNEIKCDEKSKPEKFDGYPHTYWSHNTENSGQSGVAILSKVEPKSVQYGLPIGESDSADEKKLKEGFNKEGRLITVEYDNFYLINAYVPNSGKTEKSDDFPKGYPVKVANGLRLKFDNFFKAFIKSLQEKKPVIITGDLNVAHNEIDLANPKSNDKSAGFTKEERDNFTELLKDANLVDSFRALNPDKKGAYTYWTYRGNCREKNVGWRLDYFLLSDKIRESICENTIRSDVYGSDHCPIVLFMKN